MKGYITRWTAIWLFVTIISGCATKGTGDLFQKKKVDRLGTIETTIVKQIPTEEKEVSQIVYTVSQMDSLIEALGDEDLVKRSSAAQALSQIGDPRAVEPLIEFMKKEKRLSRYAVRYLSMIGEPAVKPLIEALRDENSLIRRLASSGLGRIGEPAVEPLIKTLEDEDENVRYGAVDALGRIGDPRAVEPLIKTLGDKEVGRAAWSALSKMGRPAVKPLIKALKDEDPRVREGAARALGELSDPRAIEPLEKALEDKNRSVFWAASDALCALRAYKYFMRTYGGAGYDWGSSVQQTSDKGYIIAGRTMSFGAGDCDIYLIKTDRFGEALWTKTYGGTMYEEAYSIQVTSDGGYIIVGLTESFRTHENDEYYDVYLIKTDADGNIIWEKVYGDKQRDYGHSVQQTSDGGYIIAGLTESYGAGKGDVYLIKTNSSGDIEWAKAYGRKEHDSANCVKQTSDGGYIIVGGTYYPGANYSDVYLIKTNSSGDILWTKIEGGIGYNWGNYVQQTSDGGFVIVGRIEVRNRKNDVYVVKTDRDGNTLWTGTHGGTGDDEGYSVQETFDGGYIIAGQIVGYKSEDDTSLVTPRSKIQDKPSSDICLIKIDSQGKTIWTHIYDGGAFGGDDARSVRQTWDGGYIITGSTVSRGRKESDVFLWRADATGGVKYRRLVGTWIVEGSTEKFKISFKEGKILIEGWDIVDNERFKISNITWEGKNVKFTSITPSTSWTVHYTLKEVDNETIEAARAGDVTGTQTWKIE